MANHPIYEKFQKLGGKFSNKTKVERIIVEYNVAKGVLLCDGTTIPADFVISAADGYSTIFRMLEAKYMSKQIDFAYKNWELFTPIVQVSFGINKVIPSDCPHNLTIQVSDKAGNLIQQSISFTV